MELLIPDKRKVSIVAVFRGTDDMSHTYETEDVRDLHYNISMSTEKAKILPGICTAARIEFRVPYSSELGEPIGQWVHLETIGATSDEYQHEGMFAHLKIIDMEYIDGSGWVKLIGYDWGAMYDATSYIPANERLYGVPCDRIEAWYGYYTVEWLCDILGINYDADSDRRFREAGVVGRYTEDRRYRDFIANTRIPCELTHGRTKRELIGYVAGLMGCYGIANSTIRIHNSGDIYWGDNGILLRKWSSDPVEISSDLIYQSKLELESEQALYSQATPYIDTESTSVGDYTNPLILADNISDVAGYNDPISYVPGEIKLRGAPLVTVGDVLEVPLPSGGTARMLVCEMSLTFDGGMSTTVKCYGTAPLENIKQDATQASLRRTRCALAAREV